MDHPPKKNKDESEEIRRNVERLVDNADGLYVYAKEHGAVLYVGKAKPLKSRIWSHYLESFQPVKGDTRDNRWHRFFSSHQGPVTVYWAEIGDEDIRQITERMLTLELTPLFPRFQ